MDCCTLIIILMYCNCYCSVMFGRGISWSPTFHMHFQVFSHDFVQEDKG